MARKEENRDDFLGLFTEEANGKKEKSNGAVKLNEDAIFIEKKSRLNGKVKESYEISYDELDSEKVTRPALNRIEIELADKKLTLKTLDHEMLDKFEDKLYDIIEGPQIAEATSPQQTVRNDSAISEIDIPDQIRKYHDLYKEGIISEEEFESKKKELLNS